MWEMNDKVQKVLALQESGVAGKPPTSLDLESTELSMDPG